MQFKGYQTGSASAAARPHSKWPAHYSFVSAGASVPLAGDVCFLVFVVRAGNLRGFVSMTLFTSLPERSPQVLGAVCCHVGIEAALGDMLTIKKESKLFLGASNTECAISFSLSLKIKTAEPITVSKSGNLSSSNEGVPVASVDERSHGHVSLLNHASSSPYKNSLMVPDHRMAVSGC